MFRKLLIGPVLGLGLSGCVTTSGGSAAPSGLDVAGIVAGVRSACSVAVAAQSVIALFNTGLTDRFTIINTLCSAFNTAQLRAHGRSGGPLVVRVNGVAVHGRRVV
jgi:hypothetical protein